MPLHYHAWSPLGIAERKSRLGEHRAIRGVNCCTMSRSLCQRICVPSGRVIHLQPEKLLCRGPKVRQVPLRPFRLMVGSRLTSSPLTAELTVSAEVAYTSAHKWVLRLHAPAGWGRRGRLRAVRWMNASVVDLGRRKGSELHPCSDIRARRLSLWLLPEA